MTEPPPPMTPPGADLQDFPFMPLHVARLRDSDFAAEENPEACWYAVLLWGAAWHQLPAGSLPNNDAVLMRLVGLGRDQRTWKKNKSGALRGFVECSDGRLYHPVVAEQVREAWESKLRQRHRTFCAAVRKHNERNAADQLESPTFEAWTSLACPKDIASFVTSMSRVTDENVARDIGSKGQGQGQGQGDSNDDEGAREILPIEDWPADLIAATAEVCHVAGVRHSQPGHIIANQQVVKGWIDAGIDPATEIAPAIRQALADTTERITSLKWFDVPVRQAKARKEAQANGHQRSQSNLRGSRPDPALDLYRAGVAGLAAMEQQESLAETDDDDRRAGSALPARGVGGS